MNSRSKIVIRIFQRVIPALALCLATLQFPVSIDPAAAQSGCGNHGQSACKVKKTRVPCGRCDMGWCPPCDFNTLSCNKPVLRVGRHDGICHLLPPNIVNQPSPVDYLDNGHVVDKGYQVAVDLTHAQIIIPGKGLPDTCNGLADYPSPMRTVPQDDNAPTVPNWAQTSIYGARLAVNGSFFEVEGYYAPGYLHEEACTHVFGYTISNGQLIRPEEKIKAYSMDGPPKYLDAGTLYFFTKNYAQKHNIYANPHWYDGSHTPHTGIPPNVENAISGTQLIKSGFYVGDAIAGPDPTCRLARTAAGLSDRGNKLTLVVVAPGEHGTCAEPAEGGTGLKSLATYMINELGVLNAISLDGGGSSQMFYTNYRGTTIKTLPGDTVWRIPGFDEDKKYYRPVANFLGIR